MIAISYLRTRESQAVQIWNGLPFRKPFSGTACDSLQCLNLYSSAPCEPQGTAAAACSGLSGYIA